MTFILVRHLSYNQCDSTCYVLEYKNIPCSSYNKENINVNFQCDRDLNIFSFSCEEVNNKTIINHSCEPINEQTIKSPCDLLYDVVAKGCTSPNVVSGSCNDNGIITTSGSYSCVPPASPVCSPPMVLNSDKTACVCPSGYSLSDYGSCSRDLFIGIPEENLTQEQHSQQTQQDLDDFHSWINSGNNPVPSSGTVLPEIPNQTKFSDVKNNLKGFDDKFAGFRSDLNTTNNLLNKILDKKEQNLTANLNPQSEDDEVSLSDSFNNITKFIGDTKESLNELQTNFDETKTLISSGFTYSPATSSSCTNPSAVVFGRTIQLDICSPMQTFSPIFYLIFTIIFTYIAILIFMFGVSL